MRAVLRQRVTFQAQGAVVVKVLQTDVCLVPWAFRTALCSMGLTDGNSLPGLHQMSCACVSQGGGDVA